MYFGNAGYWCSLLWIVVMYFGNAGYSCFFIMDCGDIFWKCGLLVLCIMNLW
jgi:hypothetical protein